MQTSLHRRALPKLIIISLIALVLGVLSFSSTDAPGALATGEPSWYEATTDQDVTPKTAGATANVSVNLDIPDPSLNFYAINFFVPPEATVCLGPGHSGSQPAGCSTPVLGDIAGALSSSPGLGFTNNPCIPSAGSIDFVLMNATVDNSAGNVVYPTPQALASGGVLAPMMADDPPTGGVGGLGPGSAASIDNDLPTGVDRYPSFLNTLFGGTQPRARLHGATIVGSAVTLNFVIFSPGDLAAGVDAPNPSQDMALTSLGYGSVTVLNDPTAEAAPGSVTDFCTSLGTVSTMYGETKDNPCTDLPAAESNPDTCEDPPNWGSLNSPTPGANTGRVRSKNPASAGTYIFPTFHLSARDLDQDGYENGFDTCPYHAQPGWDGRNGNPSPGKGHPSWDPDDDNIPQTSAPEEGCDSVNNPGVDDQDTDTWQNAGDNCPLSPNSDNAEAELDEPDNISRPRGGSQSDSIGDVCDTAESVCTGAADDDGDTLVNDGCSASGAAEAGCLNSADDDNDGSTNDGCPSSSRVANGRYSATLTLDAVCIGGTDADGDGWCSSATPRPFAFGAGTVSLSDPNDGNGNITPEHYALQYPFPIAHSGANGESSGPPGARQPTQVCNDGINQDGDANTDLLDTDCRPPATAAAATYYGSQDTDGDGYNDEWEIHHGTDALGRCEKGVTPSLSSDWPADLTNGGGAFSGDKVNISDLQALAAKYGSSPGGAAYDRRYDLVPGPGSVPGAWINISDLQNIALATAPMFGGAKMYGGAVCTAHPTLND
jgi:hypothetical protein